MGSLAMCQSKRSRRVTIDNQQTGGIATVESLAPSDVVGKELQRLSDAFLDAVQTKHGRLPIVEHDEEWPSDCIVSPFDAEHDSWRPVPRSTPSALDGLEQALEAPFPAEFHKYFSMQWSSSIPVMWIDRPFELLQLWNEDDEQNLMHNLLGHALQKRRTRESLTLFFALIDDARFLSIDTSSGEIVLEEVGGGPAQVVSPDLASLLAELTAVAEVDDSDIMDSDNT